MKDEKYQKLTDHLKKQNAREIRMTLDEIESVLGFPLDPSAYLYREFWANCTASTKAYSWMEAGFEITETDLKNRTLLFRQKDWL